MAEDDGQFDISTEFKTLASRTYQDLHSLFELMKVGPSRLANFKYLESDVADFGDRIGFGAERSQEFAELWEKEFGSRQFGAILQQSRTRGDGSQSIQGRSETAADERPSKNDAEGVIRGHDADFPSAIIRFLVEYGSLDNFTAILRQINRWPLHVQTLSQSSLVFATGALEAALAGVARIRFRTHPGSMKADARSFLLPTW